MQSVKCLDNSYPVLLEILQKDKYDHEKALFTKEEWVKKCKVLQLVAQEDHSRKAISNSAKMYLERAVRRGRATESLVLIIYNDVSTINFDANTVYCMSNDTCWCFKITNAIILFRRFSRVLHKKARFPGIQSAFCVRREFLRMSSYVFECLVIYRYF